MRFIIESGLLCVFGLTRSRPKPGGAQLRVGARAVDGTEQEAGGALGFYRAATPMARPDFIDALAAYVREV